MVENQYQNIKSEQQVWSQYLYAMKSPVTRQKYTKRLEKFFDFLEMEGKTIEDKSISFLNRAKFDGDQWVFNVLKFMQSQIDRANRKEITGLYCKKLSKEHQVILRDGRSQYRGKKFQQDHQEQKIMQLIEFLQ